MTAVYPGHFNSVSSAWYQWVTTYSVIKSVSEVVCAIPKSHFFGHSLHLEANYWTLNLYAEYLLSVCTSALSIVDIGKTAKGHPCQDA